MKRGLLVVRSAAIWGQNIRTWEPPDPSCIAESVMVDIGERAKESADTFTLRVATPAGLAKLESRDGIVATRPLLVMARWDHDDLWRWLEHTVASCEHPLWTHSVDALRRHFDWEYDGIAEE